MGENDKAEIALREYQAIIWTADPSRAGQRVTVWAASLDEALRLLEKEHGEGTVFALRNLEDSMKPR